jgi:subtilisin-like proprotein convertase family protein
MGDSWRDLLAGSRLESSKRAKRFGAPRVEQLEDRTLLSVLPPITPTGVTALGTGNTPAIAYDPLNPNNMVAVFTTNGGTAIAGDSTTDGGATWTPLNFGKNVKDPTTGSSFGFADAPSVGFDRNHQVYIVYTEENGLDLAGRTKAGAVVLQKFDDSSGSPSISIQDQIIYAWAGQDPALNPMVAVDNNLGTFKDPLTQATQTDPSVDPVSGQGPVYVAWNENVTGGGSKIQLVASTDGGNSFGPQIGVNNDGNAGAAAFPRLVVAQGTVSDRPSAGVPGGEVNIVWERLSDNSLVSNAVQPGEVAAFSGTTGPITNALSGTPNVKQITTFTADVNVTNPNFVVTDLEVTVNIVHPHLSEIQIQLVAPGGVPGGAGSIDLLRNAVDAAGNKTGNGVADGANLGVLGGVDVGTTFDDHALRFITDPSAKAPYTGHFKPEFPTLKALASLAVGNTPAGVPPFPKGINGTWQLVITDFRNHAGQFEQVDNWSLHFSSGLTPGTDNVVVGANSTVKGAVLGPFADTALVAPDRGIGPSVSLAIDNTLGSFSPFQGRLYAAYTGGKGNNTDVFLVTSDDGGATWSAPAKINDDNPGDNFSEGNRAQFEPNVAVDQLTGTLVISFYDARNDASNSRVATYVTTSIDGGASLSQQTFVNEGRTVLDAITGKMDTLEPIPDNSSAGNANRDKTFGFGDRQGLVVSGGHVSAIWTGDQNSGNPEFIQVGQGTIAAGPRIVSSSMGPVSLTGINNTFALDGTQLADRFDVQFDRPVEQNIPLSQVQVIFRNPTTPPTQSGAPLNIVSVKPLDFGAFGPAGAFGATRFEVVFDPSPAKSPTGSYAGTYSYSVGPNVTDQIRQPNVIAISGTPIGVRTATDTPLNIPPDSGSGDTGGPNSPHTLSNITINDVASNQLITHVAVWVRIDHTFDSDLQIQLVAPDGTRVTLSQNEGGSGHDFGTGTAPNITPTIFDDAASTPISSGTAPFVGSFQPDSPLFVLDGKSPDGTWTLDIQDQFALDIGTLISWSLDISAGTGTTIINGGNAMDQNADGTPGQATDAYAAPRPLSGVPFQLPYDQTTQPLIVPGPHVIKTSIVGQPITPDNLVLNNTVNSMDVVFDRDMNASTFTPGSIVRMFGPAGSINGPFTITADPPGTDPKLALRTFRIGFPTQQLSGTYTVVFGPNILSAAGDAMDTNMNAGLDTLRGGNLAGSPTFLIAGITSANGIATATTMTANGFVTGDTVTISGASETAYDGTFTITVVNPSTFTYAISGNPPSPATGNGITVSKSTTAITFAFSGGPVTLAAGKTTVIPITFANNFVIQGASILLNITDTHDSDLEATLVAPDGTQIKLFTNVGNSGANFINTVLTDLATTPIQNGSASFNGSFNPQEPLSTLVGKGAAGVYKLLIKNDSASTTGTLTGWSLSLLQSQSGTGLGEPVADQATETFRIFTMDPTNPLAHDTWTAVGPASINDFAANQLITHVAVRVRIDHTFDSNLQIQLVAPDGTRVTLSQNEGAGGHDFGTGTGPNITPTIFDDGASTPISSGTAPFAGSFQPDSPLSVLDGKSPDGTWTLDIQDQVAIDTGTLISWSLDISAGTGTTIGVRTAIDTPLLIPPDAPPVGNDTGGPNSPHTLSKITINNNGHSGRIGGLAVDPSDPTGNTVYVAGASGGVWKTTDFLTTDPKGPTYTPLTDFGPTFGINIGGIAVFGRNNDPNQSIVFAATGEGDTGSTGVGFLRSMDGGATWTLLDSTTNVDSNGNPLPINSPLRDHVFVGTSAFKVIADPVFSPSGNVIVFAALTGTNGGIWRSMDSGKHWAKMRAGTATDVVFAPASASVSTGNLQILYGAFKGEGVYLSQNQGSSWNIMSGGVGDPLIRNPDTSGIPVTAPGDVPNGAKGRIVLATPFLTGNRVQDLGNEGWLYAAVVATTGGFDGLYLTKDFGQNWTKIVMPVVRDIAKNPLFPTNDETKTPGFNVTGDTLFTQGNYDLSVGIDPNNPNVVYIGGTKDANLTGFIRVDTTGVADPKNVSSSDNSNNDKGSISSATVGSIKTPLSVGLLLTDPFTGQTIIQPTVNALRDPFQPFLANATLVAAGGSPLSPSNVGGPFTNTGQDIRWQPFDQNAMLVDSTDQHRIITMRDPVTGATRLILGDDQGVFTGVDQGNGQLLESFGNVSNLTDATGNVPVVTGSRNGNLQITQFYYGAAQPSILAAQIGKALFYGNAQDDGFPVSDPAILANGNLHWNGPLGDGTGIATDQTGSGTMYTYQWPATGMHPQPTDFFSVNPKGQFDPTTGLFTSRTFGLVQQNQIVPPPGVPDPQWPFLAQAYGSVDHHVIQSNFAVNPINGDQLLISSAAGRVFRTSDQGLNWFQIGFVSGDAGATSANTLDGSYAPALAYGAPDPANPSGNLDDFIYVGTISGNIFVTFNGGGLFTKISGGLDGSSVLAIVTNPLRGSHEAYAVTLNGVYHMVDSSKAGATWQKINGNLFSLMHNAFGDPSLAAPEASFLTSVVADWRFVIPDSPANPTGPTHPALYVGGEAGVFRSMDNGKTWTIFPDVAHDGAPVDGGYLPMAHVSNLQLAVGNINTTTGKPDQANGPNLLIATTYGRGVFAIRLPNNSPFNPTPGPRVVAFTPSTPVSSFNSVTVTFSGPVDPASFTTPKIAQFTGPGGAITATSVVDITSVPLGAPNPHNVYQINFPTQTAVGVYTLTIGPNITDFAGNTMDQDNDNVNGGIPDDQFTTQVVIDPSDNGLFVSGLYHDLLGRPADTQGFLTFLAPIDAARFSLLPSFANTFVTSGEFFNNQVSAYYKQYLGRAPGPGEGAGFVTALVNGTTTDEQVIATLVSSPEFTNNFADEASWLKGVCKAILCRFDSDLQNAFLPQLQAGTPFFTIALELLTSAEYRTDLIGGGGCQIGYFHTYLGRAGSPAEVQGWVNSMAHGTTDEGVIRAFVSSQEYFQGSNGGNTNLNWFKSLYNILLKRGTTLAEVNGPLNALLNDYAPQRQADINIILNSTEHRELQVNGYFVTYLGRSASPAEQAALAHVLQTGAMTDEQLIAAIVASPEFSSTHGVTDDGSWLQAAWNAILRPGPVDLGAASALLGQLQAGVSRTTVAFELLSSDEYRTDLIGGGGNQKGFYITYLQRTSPPSEAEIDPWVNLMGLGATDEQVISALMTTAEYFKAPHPYP